MKSVKKYSFKVMAMLMLFLGTAMVATHQVIYGAEEKTVTATVPEVVVRGQQDKKSYKPTTVSSAKYTGPLKDIPQTIQVVPEGLIQDQNATSLRDALRNVPGISIAAGEGGVPAGDNLTIRGFSSRNDIFVDNVRDFGGYTRDPFNMEQLEVTKGPTSSYAGRGSAGGSVNQVSKAPKLERMFAGTVGFGSAFYKRTTLDINEPFKDFGLNAIPGAAVRVNAMLHDSDIPGRDEGEYKRVGVAPSIALGLGTPLRATFSYFYMAQDNQPDYGIPWVPAANAYGPLEGYAEQAAPVDWSNYYGFKNRDYERIQVHRLTNKLEYDVNDNVSLRNQLTYGYVERDSMITAPRFSGNTQRILRQLQSRDQVDTILNNQTDAIWNFDTGFMGHKLVTGFEYARENSRNTPRSGPAGTLADLYNPQFDDAYDLGTISSARTPNEAVSDNYAFYAFDTIALHEKLDLVGGVRWDYFDLDYRAAETTNELDSLDKELSWRAGIVYKPIDIANFYFGYGTSFNPSVEGLTASSAANATNNIAIEPEKTRTFEIGQKWEVFQEKLALTNAFYYTTKTNARTTDPGTAAATTDDVVVLEGEQRVLGMEIGAAGNITDKWRLYGGYNLQKTRTHESKVTGESGKQLVNTPSQTFNVWTTYRLPWNFEIGGGVQYTGARYSNTTNTRKADEYWLFDLMAAYHVTENVAIRVNATNITNQEYIGSVGGGHFIPGAGRQIIASTEFDF